MNEQIKKLAEQAGIEFTYDPTEMPMRAFVEAWGEDLEKFSGLIVAECAQVARNHILQKYPGMEEYDGVVFVEQAIRKHFGI
jgi:protein tyrosine phosphatase (PTP) superfamily phosphohydrolase (DUF442 family)